MQTKSAVSLVALVAALVGGATPALAAHAPVRQSGAKHVRHRRSVGRVVPPAKESSVAAHRGREPLHPSSVTHGAEPKQTPVVAAAVTAPLIFRTDGSDKPNVKPTSLRQKDPPSDTPSLLSRKEPASAKAAPPKPPCLHDVVEMSHGEEDEKFSLTTCDGAVAPMAVERMSILSRPESAQRPEEPLTSLSKNKGVELSPGIRRMDPGLVLRLQSIIDHFHKAGGTMHVSLVSGYRPMSRGSYHATGQAMDMRIDGVRSEELVAFCKTLDDTGCGYYPNSSFVHVDVRAPKTGHVSWIDASGPGESPRYVSSWPPPPPEPAVQGGREAAADVVGKLDRSMPPLPVDDHPATVDPPAEMHEQLLEGAEQ